MWTYIIYIYKYVYIYIHEFIGLYAYIYNIYIYEIIGLYAYIYETIGLYAYIYIKLFYMETHDVYMVEAGFLAPTTLMVHNS